MKQTLLVSKEPYSNSRTLEKKKRLYMYWTFIFQVMKQGLQPILFL